VTVPDIIDWAQRLQSIAQSGLTYSQLPFDRLRYEDVREIAIEMLNSVGDGLTRDALRAVFSEQQGHTTPKVDVRGVVFRDDKILLVQEKMDDHRWTLPGGWADVGESGGENVAREIWEETGYRARAVKLIAAFDRNKHEHPPMLFHAYKLFFLCELTQDEREIDPRNVETGDVGWFRADEIAALPLSIGRVTAAQIARFFEHHANPALPTDFD
jgi:ADP-ribose pyrophosphatase YjhB (NUDIX family)